MKRYRAFLIPAAGLLAILIGFLVFNIRDDLVYYKVPDEVIGDATIADTDRFRLGGQVVPGSISGSPPSRFTRSTRLVSHPRSWNDSNGAACPGRYTRWTRTRSGFRPRRSEPPAGNGIPGLSTPRRGAKSPHLTPCPECRITLHMSTAPAGDPL